MQRNSRKETTKTVLSTTIVVVPLLHSTDCISFPRAVNFSVLHLVFSRQEHENPPARMAAARKIERHMKKAQSAGCGGGIPRAVQYVAMYSDSVGMPAGSGVVKRGRAGTLDGRWYVYTRSVGVHKCNKKRCSENTQHKAHSPAAHR